MDKLLIACAISSGSEESINSATPSIKYGIEPTFVATTNVPCERASQIDRGKPQIRRMQRQTYHSPNTYLRVFLLLVDNL